MVQNSMTFSFNVSDLLNYFRNLYQFIFIIASNLYNSAKVLNIKSLLAYPIHSLTLHGQYVLKYANNYPLYFFNNWIALKAGITKTVHDFAAFKDSTNKYALIGQHAKSIIKSDKFSRCLTVLFLVFFLWLMWAYKPKQSLSTSSQKVDSSVSAGELGETVLDNKFSSPLPNKSTKHMLNSARQAGTPFSTVSTLTSDSNYRNIRQGEEGGDGEDDDDDNHSEGEHSYAPSEGTMMSGFSKIDFLLYENEIIKQSASDPRVLIGWRILVKGIGSGTVLSIKKVKFASTKFVIQFDDGKIQKLSLKRSETKGKVPFTLISKGS